MTQAAPESTLEESELMIDIEPGTDGLEIGRQPATMNADLSPRQDVGH